MHSINIEDLSILLIEPSLPQLKIILNHLEQQGVTNIEGVGSGEEALAILAHYQPDLIISSLYLPDTTAAEMIVELKQNETLSQVPFMLISSETRFSVLNPIRQAGVVAILPKPFNREDLRRALLATLEYIDPEELLLENYDVESLRVLLVDDSTTSRKHISRILNNMGIEQITTAENGKQALDIFQAEEEAFDLIVTDYNMPEMDGQELVNHIRHDMHNNYIPILMVTSEANRARLNQVQQDGVAAIFDKPFDPQTVKEILFRTLNG
ncbi:MAG: response regulator [Methylococcales bacterium]|nr:response regulator [Methylococcales bacterium]